MKQLLWSYAVFTIWLGYVRRSIYLAAKMYKYFNNWNFNTTYGNVTKVL